MLGRKTDKLPTSQWGNGGFLELGKTSLRAFFLLVELDFLIEFFRLRNLVDVI